MNALSPIIPQPDNAVRATLLALSPELRQLCEDNDREHAITEIKHLDPATVIAARLALEGQMRPTGAQGVIAALTPLLAIYPQPERSEGEWRAWWAQYAEDLADVPPAALQEGVKAYRRGGDSEFFPKPGKLRALAWEAAAPLITALGRLRAAK